MRQALLDWTLKRSGCKWQLPRLTIKGNGIPNVAFRHIQIKFGCPFPNATPYINTKITIMTVHNAKLLLLCHPTFPAFTVK